MLLVIRGHIRNSFENKNLYNLIKQICEIDVNLEIFVHTWNVFANNTSWRNIKENNTCVTTDTIYDYFNDLTDHIKFIMIDDDTKINLIGNTNGKICSSLMPIIGWKNYWYGKYKIIDYINNKYPDKKQILITMRFDVLDNSNSFSHDTIINFIKSNLNKTFTKNMFVTNYDCCGIDNIYMGLLLVTTKLDISL